VSTLTEKSGHEPEVEPDAKTGRLTDCQSPRDLDLESITSCKEDMHLAVLHPPECDVCKKRRVECLLKASFEQNAIWIKNL
jgi:hypothetical protein